jgi:formate-dependent nitrite reductase cytochrome c552 subunit
MRKAVLALTCWAVFAGFASWASARAPYFTEFKDKYTKDDEEYAKKVKAAGCAVCHDPKDLPDKKKHNVYGKELKKLLTKDDVKDKEKIRKALDTVYDIKAPGGTETFGDRIKAKKLPGEG